MLVCKGWASAARGCRGGRPAPPGGAQGRAEPSAAAGAGPCEAALAARSTVCLSVAELQAHVTKFGLSHDPGFVAFFQLEFSGDDYSVYRDEIILS